LAANTSPREPNSRAVLNANLREAFGRVVYAHKTHEKAREIESNRVATIKWVNIVLTTLTFCGLLATIITDTRAFLYVSSVLSALTLAFVIFQLSFNPEKAADSHRATAKELWYLRELFVNLLADLHRGISESDAVTRRDELTVQLSEVYSHAPDTSSRAYRAAQRALKVNEDMTFSPAEIDKFLPTELHAEV
jgi:hypothetical protein